MSTEIITEVVLNDLNVIHMQMLYILGVGVITDMLRSSSWFSPCLNGAQNSLIWVTELDEPPLIHNNTNHPQVQRLCITFRSFVHIFVTSFFVVNKLDECPLIMCNNLKLPEEQHFVHNI